MFDEYTKYPESRLLEFSIPVGDSRFLGEIGLPSWCAPNMHFDGLSDRGSPLPLLEAGGRSYLGLGSERDDRPIAIDVQAYSIWVVHEQAAPLYMAEGVLELSQSLQRFQACINAAVDADPSAFTQNRIPQAKLSPFISWAMDANPRLLSPGSFWRGVLLWLGVHESSLQADGPDRHSI